MRLWSAASSEVCGICSEHIAFQEGSLPEGSIHMSRRTQKDGISFSRLKRNQSAYELWFLYKIKGTVQHFGKHAYFLSCQKLD